MAESQLHGWNKWGGFLILTYIPVGADPHDPPSVSLRWMDLHCWMLRKLRNLRRERPPRMPSKFPRHGTGCGEGKRGWVKWWRVGDKRNVRRKTWGIIALACVIRGCCFVFVLFDIILVSEMVYWKVFFGNSMDEELSGGVFTQVDGPPEVFIFMWRYLETQTFRISMREIWTNWHSDCGIIRLSQKRL